MDYPTVLIFPGLDGSDVLLRDFVAAAPLDVTARVQSLPDVDSYSELAENFDRVVRDAGPCVLIGESFSGPLAILLAERHQDLVKHLVLVATFARSPIPPIVRLLPWSLVFRLPLPGIVSRLLIGKHEHLLPALRDAIRTQPARTKAKRISMVARVDVVVSLLNTRCPITYLQPTNDRLIHKRHGLAIAKTNSTSSIRQIDGPHLILQACPEKCWAEIQTAMAGLSQ